MALIQSSSKVKLVLIFLAIMVLMSSSFATAAVTPRDFIIKPLNLGRRVLARSYGTPKGYPTTPSGGGGYPCCN
ncbi:hypothetical protein V6N13_047416 [Hibiscus sabdariffa]|uniref:Uncharacterized protein n=2 Tax=Hibiscus sabdariffa TaxID=183260 RepID=A0ABR1Z8W8_9ROSI